MSGKSQTIGDLTVLLLPKTFPNDDKTKSMRWMGKKRAVLNPRHIMIRLTTMLVMNSQQYILYLTRQQNLRRSSKE